MPRYIDADKLFNWGGFKLSDAVKCGNKSAAQQKWSYSTIMMYEVADEIADAEIIDVEPAIHGEWKKERTAQGEKVYCNVCGKSAIDGQCTDFCPHCGAKMDGNNYDAK